MHFYSGLPMQFLSGVDKYAKLEHFRVLFLVASISWRQKHWTFRLVQASA
jgi:hypothetical protein